MSIQVQIVWQLCRAIANSETCPPDCGGLGSTVPKLVKRPDMLKLDASVLSAVERRRGRRRFSIYCPRCKA
jgi:hypothetical protein